MDKIEQQGQIFESLINLGLGNISLTPNHMLLKEQRAVIILLVAAYSQSQLIVHNFPDFYYDDVLVGAMVKIAQFIRKKGKTLIVGTQNSDVIEKVCSHTAFLLDGAVFYKGTVENFRLSYDKIMMIITDKNVAVMADRLKELLPRYKYAVQDKTLIISNYSVEENDPKLVYEKIAEAGFAPEKIEINPKKVQNACEEITRQYDLQK
jgi:ABC-2 type transport system ATP-binding protein